jgi:hypothetical protein
MINIKDEKRISALGRVVTKEHGYMKDLREDIGDELIKEFESVGFIVTNWGYYDPEGYAWHVTPFGIKYYKLVCDYEMRKQGK